MASIYLSKQDPSEGIGNGSVYPDHVELHGIFVQLHHVDPKILNKENRHSIVAYLTRDQHIS